MLMKNVVYRNFDDEEQTAQVHFHLNRKELNEYFSQYPGGWHNYFAWCVTQQKFAEAALMMTEFIDRAYGIKSPDGSQFIKTPEDLLAFQRSAVYETIIDEYVGQPDNFLDFMMAAVPTKLGKEARRLADEEMNKLKEKNVEIKD